MSAFVTITIGNGNLDKVEIYPFFHGKINLQLQTPSKDGDVPVRTSFVASPDTMRTLAEKLNWMADYVDRYGDKLHGS